MDVYTYDVDDGVVVTVEGNDDMCVVCVRACFGS